MNAPWPIFDEDLYADAVLAEPYGQYQAIRAAGPAVWLSQHDVLAMGRFAEVKSALMDHRRFRSGSGVALNAMANHMGAGTTLASDAPLHGKLRSVVGAPLRPEAVALLADQIGLAATDLVRKVVAQKRFDAVADFARILPVSIISVLVGLPEQGRERMLDWAAATFDCLGPDNERARQSGPVLADMLDYVARRVDRTQIRPESWAGRLFAAADEGVIEPDQVPKLLLDYLGPSLDTTIFATAHLIHLLGKNPEQWQLLRCEPSLIDAAIEEAVRLESPIRGFSRVVAEDVEIEGVSVPADTRVLLLFASANRDEAYWERADEFDISRSDLKHHLGFGFGRHGCAGQHLARLEMRSLLKAFVENVHDFEVGEARLQPNNVLRGLASLHVEVQR